MPTLEFRNPEARVPSVKNIVVIFDKPNDFDSPLDTEEYLTAYQDLSQFVSQKGSRLYFARAVDNSQTTNIFSEVSYFDEDNNLQHTSGVSADLIYDKAKPIYQIENCTIINHPAIKQICNDKMETYRTFNGLSPKSLFVTSADEFKAASSSFSGKVVLKPQFGSGGQGIIIDEIENIDPQKLQWPYLVQEFIDGSVGIENLVDGLHDLRMVVINGKINFSYLRIPKQGSLLSNLHLGGTVKVVEQEDLPKQALQIFDEVETEFRNYGPRCYSIDVTNTASGIKLIELNSQPGLLSRTQSDRSPEYLDSLAEFLCETADQN